MPGAALVRTCAALLACALALAACAHRGTSAPSGVLRVGVEVEPTTLAPILAESITDNEILRLIYDPLIGCDRLGNPVPALAAAVPTRANGGISADGLTIAYRLRRGVRFHDGRPFTSADVAASFRAVMDPRNPVATRHGYDVVARVETPDPYTIRFRLKRRFAPFIGTVFAESDSPYYVGPAPLLRGALVQAAIASAPVGTGPYRVVRWLHGDRLELAANASYWAGAPRIPRIVVRFIPDENSQLVGLQTGDLDAVIGLSASAAAQARTIPHVRIDASPTNGYFGFLMNTARGATADPRVRRAIAEAADAAAFRRDVTHGYYAPAIADLPTILWAADPALRPIAHDVAGARRLLEAAGYGAPRRLSLEIALVQQSQTFRSEAVLLQSELRAIGVEAHLHGYLSDTYSAPLAAGGILARGRYDIALYNWISGMDPDDSSQLTCAERPPNGYDQSFYCSAAMDAAQRDALASYDESVRKKAYARVEALLLRDVPIAYLGSPVKIAALRDDVGGFSPSLITRTANAERWTLRR
ncbi:MAG TPA: ABC transporter substrate-binding protein [Candidatus Baltobacteraceae bacterium]|nr:ABC transporter substrate-binding protein [Candidatus Baltobacteraceae bacterium]